MEIKRDREAPIIELAFMLKRQMRRLDNEIKEKKMIGFKEKIFQPFAFLNISASLLATHCQAAQADSQTKACQRVAILLNTSYKLNFFNILFISLVSILIFDNI